MSNKLSRETNVFELSRFLAPVCVLQSLRLYSQKLNKLGGPFFIFANNVFPSIQIAKNIPSGVKVRGLQSPQISLRAQNFKIFIYLHSPCPNG